MAMYCNDCLLHLIVILQGSDDAVEFSVNVRILGDEKRFGFSVMGGVDEGFPPRIDEVSPGMKRSLILTLWVFVQ